MRIFLWLCLFSVLNASDISIKGRKIPDTHKFKLYDVLKTNFQESLINSTNDLVQELDKFQRFILKSRNADCLFRKYGDLEEYNTVFNELNNENEEKLLEFIGKWSFNSSNYTNEQIIDSFNHMV